MLAEQKSKQKWSEDPRNMKWSTDKDRYGYQMLEKMGWADGKGLGRDKTGSTSHVKIKKRKQNLGLGAKESHDNDWLAQQEDFNNLLSALQKHGGNAELQTEEQNRKAMLEVAKASRKRVFYKRFIRSKDTSKYSQADMECIFGSAPSQSAPATPLNQSDDEVASEDSVASCPTVPCDATSGFVTYTSKQNIQEYFAHRMRELQGGKGIEKSAGGKQGECLEGQDGIGKDEVVDKQGRTEVDHEAESGKKVKRKKREYSEDCSGIDSQKMKKRKRSRVEKEQKGINKEQEGINKEQEGINKEQEGINKEQDGINNHKTDEKETAKKSRRRKKKENNGIVDNVLDIIEDETLSKRNKMKRKKGKKRKMKSDDYIMANGLGNVNEVVESVCDEDTLTHSGGEAVAKKIKSKKGKSNDDVFQDSVSFNAIENDLDSVRVKQDVENISLGKESMKSKIRKQVKGRKKETKKSDDQETMANEIRDEPQTAPFRPVKKNKKRKSKC
ncbi:PIN2/TERF1-interacting telomerase inhibitor 1-like [Dendronephthya gigantea]|uniref:PIN2/TERF1-interacting telomerase inhibitor 1-like n=1 Tax=Dendronephthya gigantea TaxID=151771 RepID=UPI00106BEAE8|nr:PIN2/TERF1-interacting telomerase inhibitor 1-like [Dendronephthya gigantea]